MTTECTSEVRSDSGTERITAGEITAWIARLPKQALISAIEHDKGSQRDPWPVLVGLRATWTESR